MRKLHRLYDEQRQSVWVDDLKRAWLRSGYLQRLVDAGIRGVTDNPTIFQKSFEAGDDYDDELATLLADSPEAAYWQLAVHDVASAAQILRPVFEESEGSDGFVSLELSPGIAHDVDASVASARELFERVDVPNLFVKVPATAVGVRAIEHLVADGRDINVTLIFGLRRYEEVLEAYFAGLEARAGDLASIHGVASFFLSRVDTEVDKRLARIGTPDAIALRGTAATAQAKVAYDLFRERCAGPRWDALSERGARLQRPLWASTGTKDPDYSDLLYVESLIGPDTVTTMPEATIAAFLDHGRIARTIHEDLDTARATLDRLGAVGIDLDDVSDTLEREGVAKFEESYDSVLQAIDRRAHAGAR